MKNQNFFRVTPFSLALLFFLFISRITPGQNWNIETTFPGGYPNRTGAIAVSVGTTAYFGSGFTDAGIVSDFWKYDMSTKAWTRLSDIPGLPRFHAFSFAIGNKIYVGGGLKNQLWATLNDFYVFDIATNTWSSLPNLPVALSQTSAFTIQGRGYVACGFVYANESSGWTYVKSTYCYDPSTSTWTKKADFPGHARGFVVAFSIGNFAYVGGGIYIFQCCAESILYEDFWQYNPVTDSWTRKTNVNNGVDGSGHLFQAISSSDCSNGFAVGGYYNLPWDSSNKTIQYDPSSDSWSTKASFPVAISSGAGWNFNGFIYAGFGYHAPNGNIYSLNVYGTSITLSQSPICNQSTFTIQSPPPYLTSISWSSNYGLSFDANGIATRIGNTNGSVTVTALANTSCGTTHKYLKDVWVGLPNNPVIFDGSPISYGLDCSTTTQSYADIVTHSLQGQAGVATSGHTDFTLYVFQGPVTGSKSGDNTYSIMTKATTAKFSVAMSATNSCGALGSCVYFDNSGVNPYSKIHRGKMSVHPNPASTTLSVQIEDDFILSNELDQPFEVKIFNRFSQNVFSTKSWDKVIQIPLEGMPSDIYYINVFYNGDVLQEQVLVKR